MMTTTPTISVLMPAYNAEKYICEAIDSILAQTFTDFEFIIINDGSTDKTEELILQNTDPRIRYYKNDQNLGIVGTLNRGLELCRGKYIARMDADDISLPERFAKQVAHMDANPNLVACGAQYSIINDDHQFVKKMYIAHDPTDVRDCLLLYCQFSHSSMLMSSDLFTKYGLRYKEQYRHAEDYMLWVDCMQYGDMANIPECLHYMRNCPSGISMSNTSVQLALTNEIRLLYAHYLGIPAKHSLSEIASSTISLNECSIVFESYFDYIKKISNQSILRKYYISLLKHHIKCFDRYNRIVFLIKYHRILTYKDMLSIIIKSNVE